MEAKLHLIKGNPKGKQVEVSPGTLTVGRAEDSDLIIASTRISRHHCEIVNDQGRLVIRDKDSGNGTFVNGRKIQEQDLAPGDEVRIGPLTFTVEIGGVRERPGKPTAPAKAAQAVPAPKRKAAAKPAAARAKPKAPAPPTKQTGADDILSSLERLAGSARKKPPSARQAKPKDDEVLEISDEDLLDSDS